MSKLLFSRLKVFLPRPKIFNGKVNRGFSVFFALIICGASFSIGLSQPAKIHRESLRLLGEAKNYMTAGNKEMAEILFGKARLYSPGLSRPYYLDRALPPIPPIPVQNERQNLMNAVQMGSQSLEIYKAPLEDLLKKNPSDQKARGYLLQIAQKQKNAFEMKRHRSVLKPPPEEPGEPFWKLGLMGFLLGLTGWQIKKMCAEIQELKKGDPKSVRKL